VIETILKVAPLLLTVVQLLLAWVIWSMRKEFVRQTDCATHKKELASCHAALAARVTSTEADIGNMPQPAAWSKMQVAIEEVRGSNRVVLAKLEGQNELLKRIEHPMQLLMEHHLKGEK
jgi:hypothetical protein